MEIQLFCALRKRLRILRLVAIWAVREVASAMSPMNASPYLPFKRNTTMPLAGTV
jgi:hypothetical protein